MGEKFSLIEHEISKFGKLEVVLHGFSSEYYENILKDGIIGHLKRIDQLGFISQSHPGNNHKRWDYVCLQLYLLHRLKHATFRIGLNSQCKSLGLSQLSRLELLQIAVLFSSMGHLPGTLASETALFELLENSKKRKDDFLNKISLDADWKKYADKIFVNHDFYKLKILIALNYSLNHVKSQTILKAIKIFFKDSLSEDVPDLRSMKHIFLRVRQISFLYLDSFNSDLPLQLDISKLLLNPFNYGTLFNPNSSDYSSFFNEAETSLCKKIYISPQSCNILKRNKQLFLDQLKSYRGSSKIQPLYSDFLYSFLKNNISLVRNTQSYSEYETFQFYLSKEDIRFFYMVFNLIDFNQGNINVHSSLKKINGILITGLQNKRVALYSYVHDQRKTLYFFNLHLNKQKLKSTDLNQFICNYFRCHELFLKCFSETIRAANNKLSDLAFNHSAHHYCRKMFLQLMKILFKYDKRLNAYIKFENQNTVKRMINTGYYPTGYVKGKSEILKLLKWHIINKEKTLARHIINNLKIAQSLVLNSKIKKNMRAFFCLFPIELENIKYDINKHYLSQNPEIVETLTDIDFSIVLFNNTQSEFYLIEGKNVAKSFESKVRKDFRQRMKPNLAYPKETPEMNIINKNGAKGGYLKFSNL